MKREDALLTLIGVDLLYGYLSNNLASSLFAFLLFLYILHERINFNPKVDVEVKLPERLEEGKITEVNVVVRNRGSKGILEVKIEGEDLIGEAKRVKLDSGEKLVKLSVKPLNKGDKVLKVKALFEDELNLYYSEVYEAEFSIQVLPSVDSIREAAREEVSIRMREALKKGKIGVESTELYGLREYLPGDDVRRIDWKATTRLRKLIVKEFMRESEGDVYIVLDATREMRKRIRRSKIDYASSLVLYIATILIRSNKRVGLILFSEDEFKVVKPEKGSEQLERIRETLRFKPLKGLTSFKGEVGRLKTWDFLRKLFPRKRRGVEEALLSIRNPSYVILITDLMSNTPRLYSAVSMVKKKHKVIILSPNPVLFYSGELDEETLRFLYEKYRERERILRKFNSLVPTVDLGPSDYGREVLEVLEG
ncbi:DUF58 domain-containing protein [Pyrococcus horikoshii]|uniref:VWFA domain-containing protein n=2 Tax=Pyrococcus horikoshii TaxID=53953 RepID=O58124_PYRHO|nr:DUF58 domain-containing protein [Pyrococcus horikoshii]BAA29462.1 422aa long hypothetical protein [Pyrococcus horikoshii OT3]HII61040.1 DUF58 domain-containing protein [Pyrococcus horikoshii]